MSILVPFRSILADERGTAAEFALILPIAVLFFVGIMDAGLYAYTFNRGEKATQTGARWAVVTDPLTPELTAYSLVGTSFGGVPIAQGDRLPQDALGTITCTSTTCDCTGTCPSGYPSTTYAPAFNALLSRMQDIMPQIEEGNLIVEYTGSGLGYAGNPHGMDVAPFVTVRLQNMQYSSILLFGNPIGLPDFSYTLTMEDGSGTGSN